MPLGVGFDGGRAVLGAQVIGAKTGGNWHIPANAAAAAAADMSVGNIGAVIIPPGGAVTIVRGADDVTSFFTTRSAVTASGALTAATLVGGSLTPGLGSSGCERLAVGAVRS